MSRSANTWWSGRFLRSLERLGLGSARSGRNGISVRSLMVGPGGVEARVFDEVEYLCRLEFAPLTDFEWEESFERLAFSDLSAAALLTTGRLPPQIEDFFSPSGRRLLPQGEGDVEFSCGCPSPAVMCEHLAVVSRVFAGRLDRDPWLLFLMRGRSAEQVMAALAERWNRGSSVVESTPAMAPTASAPPIPEDVDLFWSSAHPLDPSFAVPSERISPTVDRLGTPEPKVEEATWRALLEEVYGELARRARNRLDEE